LKPKSKILIIAGSDSSGGAGIQADIKTVTALGSYAMTAITAITSQNTTGIKSIVSIDAKEISNQIEFTAKDIKPDAIKIGMLHSTSVINAVVKSLSKIKIKKIILDPVMVAKGGTKLINSKAIKTLKKKLIKKVSLITPNIPEAEVLINSKIRNKIHSICKSNGKLFNGSKTKLKQKYSYQYKKKIVKQSELVDIEETELEQHLKEVVAKCKKNDIQKIENDIIKHQKNILDELKDEED